jgi:hypothetical protein
MWSKKLRDFHCAVLRCNVFGFYGVAYQAQEHTLSARRANSEVRAMFDEQSPVLDHEMV